MSNESGSDDTRPFARPFGGIPVESDFIPSLLFGLGFAITFGINLYSFCRRRTQTITKTPSLSVACERMVVTSFRMAQALRLDARESWGITEYVQAALSSGTITLMQEQSCMVLSAATSATRDGLTYRQWLKAIEKNPGMKESRQAERDGYRKWMERMEYFAGITQCCQIAIAVQAEITEINRNAPWILYCRFITNLMSLIVVAGLLLSTSRRLREVDGINKAALKRINLSLSLISLVPISRCLLSFETSTTLSTSPQDAGNIISKVAFYLFQLLPELAVCFITATTDYKTLCDTGRWGDYPRARVEKGLPPKPAWAIALGSFFTPCTWPRLLANWVLRMRSQRAIRREYGHKSEFSSHQDREKLLPGGSSIGWRSFVDLEELEDERPRIPGGDTEKESTRTVWSFSSSSPSGRGGSETSSNFTISSRSSLIEDVNLWTPRLPTAFTFDVDNRQSR